MHNRSVKLTRDFFNADVRMHDLKLDKDEAKDIKIKNFSELDANGDNYIDLIEWLRFHSCPDGASAAEKLFSSKVFDKPLTILRTRVRYPEKRILIILSMMVYSNIEPKNVAFKLNSLGKNIKNPDAFLDAFPYMLEAGIDSKDIKKLWNELPSNADGNLIADIADAGINDIKQIKYIHSVIADTPLDYRYAAKEALVSMLDVGIIEVDKTLMLLKEVQEVDLVLAFFALPEALNAMKTMGIKGQGEVLAILRAVINSTGENAVYALDLLPAMLKTGIKKPDQISEFLTPIINSLEPNCFPVIARCALPAFLEVGIVEPNRILEIITPVLNIIVDESIVDAMKALSAIIKSGIKEPDKISAIFLNVFNATGRDAGLALFALPNALNALGLTDIKGPDKVSLLISIINETGRHAGFALEALPTMLKAGIKESDKISSIMVSVVNVARRNIEFGLRLLPEVIDSLIKSGLKYEDDREAFIKAIIAKIINKVNNP